MKSKSFSCDPSLDVSFIPFMPATVDDRVELRVEIRANKADSLLDAVLLLDGEEIHRVEREVVEKYYFFNDSRFYGAGGHTLLIRYKESSASQYDETSIRFEIEKDRLPLLSGGFVMLGPPNDRTAVRNFVADTKKMTDRDWENYIDEMNALGIKCLIITATVQLRAMKGENTAHYRSSIYPPSDICAKDPIRAILNAAERNGQKVFIGLGHTYGGALPNTENVMDEIYSLYGDSPAFYGWYESEEMNIRRNVDALLERGAALRRHAFELCPVKPFFVSPYAAGANNFPESGGVSPDFLEKLSSGSVAFDIIAPQDMVGHTIEGGRLTVKESREMHRVLAEAAKSSGKHLWANCEAFDFTEDMTLVPRFEGGGFSGENGYIQQIEAVAPYAEKTVTFMLNGFFTPDGYIPKAGGDLAVKMCEDYRAYRKAVLKQSTEQREDL